MVDFLVRGLVMERKYIGICCLWVLVSLRRCCHWQCAVVVFQGFQRSRRRTTSCGWNRVLHGFCRGDSGRQSVHRSRSTSRSRRGAAAGLHVIVGLVPHQGGSDQAFMFLVVQSFY